MESCAFVPRPTWPLKSLLEKMIIVFIIWPVGVKTFTLLLMKAGILTDRAEVIKTFQNCKYYNIIMLILQMRKLSLESSSKLSKVTELLFSTSRIQIQMVWFQNSYPQKV